MSNTIQDALNDMLQHYRLKKRFREEEIIQLWRTQMGASIAEQTRRVFIKDNVLYVELDSAPLKNELNMAKTKIAEAFCRQAGEQIVEEVVFI